MSFEALNWALKQGDVTPGQKLILLILANYADENHACFPGQERLARESNQSVRAVRDQLKHLEQVGLLTRLSRYRINGGRTSDLYVLSVGGIPAGSAGGSTGGAYRQDLPGAPEPSAGEPLLEPPGEEISSPTGEGEMAEQLDQPPSLFPELLESNSPPARARATRERNEAQHLREFGEKFWPAYPRGVGKLAAQRAYLRARRNGATMEELVTAAAVFADKCVGKEARFIPHASTWLNGGRWMDAPEEAASGALSASNGHRAYQDEDYWKDGG